MKARQYFPIIQDGVEFRISTELHDWIDENPTQHFALLGPLVAKSPLTSSGEIARAELYRAPDTGRFYVKLFPHSGCPWQQVWRLEHQRTGECQYVRMCE